MKETKLNLGCGTDIRKGWINVDIALLPGVDVVHDLNEFPYPFEDNNADCILMKHTLEHLDNIVKVMEECHRILKSNGKLEIIVPYYKHEDAFADPTHKHFFTEHSMDYFLEGNSKYANWYSEKKFRLIEFEKYTEGFPFWHIKKYFGVAMKISALRWILEAIK